MTTIVEEMPQRRKAPTGAGAGYSIATALRFIQTADLPREPAGAMSGVGAGAVWLIVHSGAYILAADELPRNPV